MNTATDYATKARTIIRENIEDIETVECVAILCDKHAGKPLTKRFSDFLTRETGTEWTIRRNYGMTHLETLAYQRSDCNPSPEEPQISLLIAHSETNVSIPIGTELEEKNPAYFEGARERNAARRKVLDSPGLPPELDSVLGAMNELGRAYEHVIEQIKATGCDSYSVPDWYAIRAAILPENLDDSNKARHISTDLA